MKKTNKLILTIIIFFVVLLGTTIFTSFSSNTDTQEVIVKSITPVYDSNSTIEVENNNVVFNDKNQVVEYKVVIENTKNYDVKINDITLSTPTEEFLTYEVQNIEENDILEANSTKELTIYLETKGIKGWGRNFSDELTANISFDRITKNEEVEPPKEEPNKPEKPAQSIQEIINNSDKIEIIKVTKNTIEFKETAKLEKGDKIAVWLYSDPIFLGYFDVVENNGVKQIVGLDEALKKVEIKEGKHNIVLVSSDNETIGYVGVYVNENKNISSEPIKEESSEEEVEDDSKIENPYTNTGWLIVYVTIAGTAVIGIVVLRNKKVNKYFILVVLITSTLSFVKAEEVVELPITLNVSFKSQNVMKSTGCEVDLDKVILNNCDDYWKYYAQIKNFTILNEITEIKDYKYRFDVTEEQNGRVIAYMVINDNNSICTDEFGNGLECYDLYLEADGTIYPNADASIYFAGMLNLDSINNLNGFDTSEVTNMFGMFACTGFSGTSLKLYLENFDTRNVTNMNRMFWNAGYNSSAFTLSLGDNFDTSKVTDMSFMFSRTAYNSTSFTLDLGDNFDTSNVTNMSSMFYETNFNSESFTLDLGDKFDTSKVTDMSSMFYGTGVYSESYTLDLGDKFDTSKVTNMSNMFAETGFKSNSFSLYLGDKFDTSNVTDMSDMFRETGHNSENFTLDVSNFDTSNVTDMSGMFSNTGSNSENFTLDVSNFDTSNVTDMRYMFQCTGYNSENFTLDLGDNFDTSNVTDMSSMFASIGYNSTKLNTSITISNPNTTSYEEMFYNVATKEETQIKVNYTKETETLVDKMIATKSPNSNVVKGNLIVDADNLSLGDEIHISGEKFNVISQTDDTVTMLAQYTLGSDYRQTTDTSQVAFAYETGWEYTPGPKEIDVQTWGADAKTLLNNYVFYLRTELEDTTISGNLITLKELESLGCTVPSDYSWGSGDWTCTNSSYKLWLANGQYWWTRSASSSYFCDVWYVNNVGGLNNYDSVSQYGIRPVITISKERLRGL